MIVYIHPKCSTCRKATEWLTANGIEFSTVDIRESPPGKAELLRALRAATKPSAVFNTSGQLYREQGIKDKLPGLDEDEIIELLRSDGMLIKRPFAVRDDAVLVGFREPAWREACGV